MGIGTTILTATSETAILYQTTFTTFINSTITFITSKNTSSTATNITKMTAFVTTNPTLFTIIAIFCMATFGQVDVRVGFELKQTLLGNIAATLGVKHHHAIEACIVEIED